MCLDWENQMKRTIMVSLLLIFLSEGAFAAATVVHKKLTIKEINLSSIAAVRKMYNKKKNKTLHVGKSKGYASCELYQKGNKGTCTVQFPGRAETITKCNRLFLKGRNLTKCRATNLLFFFPNAKTLNKK